MPREQTQGENLGPKEYKVIPSPADQYRPSHWKEEDTHIVPPNLKEVSRDNLKPDDIIYLKRCRLERQDKLDEKQMEDVPINAFYPCKVIHRDGKLYLELLANTPPSLLHSSKEHDLPKGTELSLNNIFGPDTVFYQEADPKKSAGK